VTVPTHALSLIEPWATLLAIGAKRNETRDWSTSFRGPFAIHASKKLDKECCREEPFASVLQEHFACWNFLDCFRLGFIIGVAELLDDRPSEEMRPHQTAQELAFGDYYDGRRIFVCDYAQTLLTPIPARGMLNFWRLTHEQRREIATQLRVPFEVPA